MLLQLLQAVRATSAFVIALFNPFPTPGADPARTQRGSGPRASQRPRRDAPLHRVGRTACPVVCPVVYRTCARVQPMCPVICVARAERWPAGLHMCDIGPEGCSRGYGVG